MIIVDVRDGIDHVNPELDTAVSVVRSGLWDTADTIVTVAQQLDTETMVLIGQFVEPESISLIIIATDNPFAASTTLGEW